MCGPSKGLMPPSKPLLHCTRQALLTQLDLVVARTNKGSGSSGLFQTKSKIVDTLDHPANAILGDQKPSASNLGCHEMPEPAQPVLDRILQTALHLRNVI